MNDFYHILGVEANCSFNEITDAYIKLSKKFHPELNPGDLYFEKRFREVNEAFQTLSDPHRRSRYDREAKELSLQKKSITTASAASSVYKPLRRGPGVGMSVILIVIALIIGVYIIQWFSTSKVRPANPVPAISTVSYKVRRPHKKKHFIQGTSAVESAKPTEGKPAVDAAPEVSESKPAAPSVIAGAAKPPVVNSVTPDDGNYLYATYVMPNATGIVNLRKAASYNSDIVQKIPANSQVLVLEKGGAYYKVSFYNRVGYVPRWSLKIK